MFNDGRKTNKMTVLNDMCAQQEKRYCSIKDSLKQSLKEVKLYKQGKLTLQTWEEYINKG